MQVSLMIESDSSSSFDRFSDASLNKASSVSSNAIDLMISCLAFRPLGIAKKRALPPINDAFL
jgi:hypothetical protein